MIDRDQLRSNVRWSNEVQYAWCTMYIIMNNLVKVIKPLYNDTVTVINFHDKQSNKLFEHWLGKPIMTLKKVFVRKL